MLCKQLPFSFFKLLSHILLFVTPQTVTHQAPLSMRFPRQQYWSKLPFPPGYLPYPGIKHGSSTLQADSLPTGPPEKPTTCYLHELLCPSVLFCIMRIIWIDVAYNVHSSFHLLSSVPFSLQCRKLKTAVCEIVHCLL